MNNIKSPAFRTAVGGFNKQDVTEYISKLCHEYDESLTEREDELYKLRAELRTAREKIAELTKAAKANEKAPEEASEPAVSAPAAAVDADAPAAPAVPDAQAIELERANNLIAAQCEQLAAKDAEIDKMRSELDEAAQKLERYASLDAKIAQYDSMTNRMGEIFMEATADAERIRSDAKLASEALMAKTAAECRNRRIVAEAQLDKFAENRKDELTRLFDETQADIMRSIDAFAEKSRTLANESISESLDGFETSK